MKRLQRAALLISLVEALRERGSWCGATHIQKSLYFLQELLGLPLGMRFIPYKHGPYSFDLNHELEAMQADYLLEDELQPYPYGPKLLPGKGSMQIKEKFPRTIDMYSKQIEFIADKFGDKKVSDLERLATALYVTRNPEENGENRAERVHQLKPHIKMEDALSAVSDVDKIIKEAERLKV
jgi:uncharacterized protein YwgA